MPEFVNPDTRTREPDGTTRTRAVQGTGKTPKFVKNSGRGTGGRIGVITPGKKPLQQDPETRYCNALLKDHSGKRCTRTAGWGTEHKGWGTCRYHGGTSPSHNKKAMRDMVIATRGAFFGSPIKQSPEQVLLDEVYRTNGYVAWINNRISEFDLLELDAEGKPTPESLELAPDLRYMIKIGYSPAALHLLHQWERDHLVKVAGACLSAGIAERLVRLEEERGRMVGAAFQQLIDGLELTGEQKARAPMLMRQALMELSAIDTTSEETDR